VVRVKKADFLTHKTGPGQTQKRSVPTLSCLALPGVLGRILRQEGSEANDEADWAVCVWTGTRTCGTCRLGADGIGGKWNAAIHRFAFTFLLCCFNDVLQRTWDGEGTDFQPERIPDSRAAPDCATAIQPFRWKWGYQVSAAR